MSFKQGIVPQQLIYNKSTYNEHYYKELQDIMKIF